LYWWFLSCKNRTLYLQKRLLGPLEQSRTNY